MSDTIPIPPTTPPVEDEAIERASESESESEDVDRKRHRRHDLDVDDLELVAESFGISAPEPRDREVKKRRRLKSGTGRAVVSSDEDSDDGNSAREETTGRAAAHLEPATAKEKEKEKDVVSSVASRLFGEDDLSDDDDNDRNDRVEEEEVDFDASSGDEDEEAALHNFIVSKDGTTAARKPKRRSAPKSSSSSSASAATFAQRREAHRMFDTEEFADLLPSPGEVDPSSRHAAAVDDDPDAQRRAKLASLFEPAELHRQHMEAGDRHLRNVELPERYADDADQLIMPTAASLQEEAAWICSQGRVAAAIRGAVPRDELEDRVFMVLQCLRLEVLEVPFILQYRRDILVKPAHVPMSDLAPEVTGEELANEYRARAYTRGERDQYRLANPDVVILDRNDVWAIAAEDKRWRALEAKKDKVAMTLGNFEEARTALAAAHTEYEVADVSHWLKVLRAGRQAERDASEARGGGSSWSSVSAKDREAVADAARRQAQEDGLDAAAAELAVADAVAEFSRSVSAVEPLDGGVADRGHNEQHEDEEAGGKSRVQVHYRRIAALGILEPFRPYFVEAGLAGDVLSGVAEPPLFDDYESPEEVAERARQDLGAAEMFQSASELLVDVHMALAEEYGNNPRVRDALRKRFWERAVITTRPTSSGISLIDPFHEYADIKRLDRIPVSALMGTDRFLRIRRAETEKLVSWTLNLIDAGNAGHRPTSSSSPLLENDFVSGLLSPDVNRLAEEWNHERYKAFERAVKKVVVPDLLREVLTELELDAEYHGTRMYREALRTQLLAGPYKQVLPEGEEPRVESDSDESDDEGPARLKGGRGRTRRGRKKTTRRAVVIGAVWGSNHEPAYLAALDKRGELVDQLVLHHLYNVRLINDPNATLDEQMEGTARIVAESDRHKADLKAQDELRLAEFLAQHRPQVVGIGALRNKLDTRLLFETIFASVEGLYQQDTLGHTDVHYVPGDAAELYGNGVEGSDEFPDFPALLRTAISVGRRLQDPLAELVRLVNDGEDLAALPLHPVQRYLPRRSILSAIEQEVVDAVCQVGVDLRLAASHTHKRAMLQFVAGLGPRKARALLEAASKVGGVVRRTKPDNFDSVMLDLKRKKVLEEMGEDAQLAGDDEAVLAAAAQVDLVELGFDEDDLLRDLAEIDDTATRTWVLYRRSLEGIIEERLGGEHVFRNAAGFIRIGAPSIQAAFHVHEEGGHPLDITRVHPDTYTMCWKMAYDVVNEDVEGEADPTQLVVDPKHIAKLMRLLFEDRETPPDDEELDRMAAAIAANGQGNRRCEMYAARDEMVAPFRESRPAYEFMLPEDVFFALSGESPESLRPGTIVTVRVTHVMRYVVKCELDSGVTAEIQLQNLCNDAASGPVDEGGMSMGGSVTSCQDRVRRDQLVHGRVQSVDPITFVVQLNTRQDCLNPEVSQQFKDRIVELERQPGGEYLKTEVFMPKWIAEQEAAQRAKEYEARATVTLPKADDFDIVRNLAKPGDVELTPDEVAGLQYSGVAPTGGEGEENAAAAPAVAAPLSIDEEAAKGKFTARVVVHPRFKNVSFRRAEHMLEAEPLGSVLFRPSTRGLNHFSMTWKFCLNPPIFVHLTGEEPEQYKRPNRLKLGRVLLMSGEQYESLNEIVGRGVEPMNQLVREVMAHKNWLPGVTEETVASTLAERKRAAGGRTFQYGFHASIRHKGRLALSFATGSSAKTEFIGLTPAGFRFCTNSFPNVDSLVRFFKKNWEKVMRGHYQERRVAAARAASARANAAATAAVAAAARAQQQQQQQMAPQAATWGAGGAGGPGAGGYYQPPQLYQPPMPMGPGMVPMAAYGGGGASWQGGQMPPQMGAWPGAGAPSYAPPPPQQPSFVPQQPAYAAAPPVPTQAAPSLPVAPTMPGQAPSNVPTSVSFGSTGNTVSWGQ